MDLIEVGQIVNTHGVRGEVKVNPWVYDLCEFEDFKNYYYLKNGSYIKLNHKSLKFHKNCAIIKFAEIEDMTQAETYKGVVLFSEKNKNLPDDVYYVQDLIGLKVLAEDEEIGLLDDVLKTGANDVYSVKTNDGKTAYIPAVKDFIKEINFDEKIIKINLIDGLLD